MSLVNMMQREGARNHSASGMVGIVDSYDDKAHTIKVKFLTEVDDDGNPRISGWIPIGSSAGGGDHSMVFGPSIGDQVEIGHLEGSPETPIVKRFLHNDVDQPPNVKSGEMRYKNKTTGTEIYADKNGAMTITGGSTVVLRAGSVTLTISSSGVAISGGTLTHNSHDVGSTHKHSGVTTGGGNTDVPL